MVSIWAAATGWEIQPHGLDISPGLVKYAQSRLPHRADRIFAGNVIDWIPPRRFDFVRTGLEYVPPFRRAELVARLLQHFVASTGRLIIGPFHDGSAEDEVKDVLCELDVARSGEAKTARSNGMRQIVWIDAANLAP